MDNVKLIAVIMCVFLALGIGVGLGHTIWANNNANIAPTYELIENYGCYNLNGDGLICEWYGGNYDFDKFWQEVTRNTEFTYNTYSVEITDVQVFYRTDSHCTISDTGIGTILYDCKCYKNGNITYYPSGIENSQTYVAPVLNWTIANTTNCNTTCITYVAPTPMLTPTPCPKCYLEYDELILPSCWIFESSGWHEIQCPCEK